MNQTITITLIKPLIIEAVKSETFLRGQIDKAADAKATTMAYHEQAGNEDYHERLLARGLYTSLSELKTQLADYLSSSGQSSGDNNISSVENDTNIIVHLTVSDRFNRGFTDPLAKLCSKYIEESMLMDWWKPINEKQSALYAQFVERDLSAIRRCFNKTAPTAPSVPYTTKLEVYGTSIELSIGEEDTVTYVLSDGAIDDIECRVDDGKLIEVGRSEEGFTVKGLQRGHTYLYLSSRHNSELEKVLHVYVRSNK